MRQRRNREGNGDGERIKESSRERGRKSMEGVGEEREGKVLG